MPSLMNKQTGKKNVGNATCQNTVIRAVSTHFSKKKKLNRKFKQPVCINVVVTSFRWIFFVWFDCFLFCLIKLEARSTVMVHIHEAAALSQLHSWLTV